MSQSKRGQQLPVESSASSALKIKAINTINSSLTRQQQQQDTTEVEQNLSTPSVVSKQKGNKKQQAQAQTKAKPAVPWTLMTRSRARAAALAKGNDELMNW